MNQNLLAALALLLIAPSPPPQRADEPPVVPQKEVKGENPSGPSDEPSAAAIPNAPANEQPEPVIRIREGIAAASPSELAEKLSAILGVKVVMPAVLRQTPIVEEGNYPVSRLLKKVAREAGCRWVRVFNLSAEKQETGVSSVLPPTSALTTVGRYSGERLARVIERRAGVRLRVPSERGGEAVDLNMVETPADKVIAHFAERLGLHSTEMLIFEPASSVAGVAPNDEQDCLDGLFAESEQKAQLLDSVTIAGAMDIDDEQFPWESMASLFGLIPGLTVDQFTGLIVGLQIEAEMRRLIRSLDPDLGSTGNPLGNGEP